MSLWAEIVTRDGLLRAGVLVRPGKESGKV
jgi:hypothetical protein